MSPSLRPHRSRSAFTMVEVMIVVAIILDLAIIAIPAYDRARKTAQNGRFAADLRVAVSAFEMYANERGAYPPESASGVMPTGMDQYLHGVEWAMRNSLAGHWDWDFNQGYARAAVCTVQDQDADQVQMTELDARIDNGILSTGGFRERDARHYASILED